MTAPVNRRIVLARRPTAAPTPDDFRLEQAPVPAPGAGEMLCRTIYLSLDPYMRGRMNAGASYAAPVEIGGVMEGGAVSVVEASNHPDYAPGDVVVARTGWQDYAVADGAGMRKLDARAAPLSTALGVLGMPGMIAYCGLLSIGRPEPGETVAVAAATGAVGGAVGQIARIKGCRAVAIAGGADKCAVARDELGFDAAVDRRAPDFEARLAEACPDGIDVYFENVGGAVLGAVMPLMNPFSRLPVCGQIAHYNDTAPPAGPDRLPGLMMRVLVNRITVRGFIVRDFADQQDAFLRDMGGWLREGRIRYREDVIDGLDNAPAGLIGLLEGRNFGKVVVKVSAEP